MLIQGVVVKKCWFSLVLNADDEFQMIKGGDRSVSVLCFHCTLLIYIYIHVYVHICKFFFFFSLSLSLSLSPHIYFRDVVSSTRCKKIGA